MARVQKGKQTRREKQQLISTRSSLQNVSVSEIMVLPVRWYLVPPSPPPDKYLLSLEGAIVQHKNSVMFFFCRQ